MKLKLLLSCFIFASCFITKTSAQRIISSQLKGYNGINSIIYPNGYYQGHIYNGVADGIGTYYFKDGTIYYGSFYNGWRNGPGIIIIPHRGFISSCWDMGHLTEQQCKKTQANLPSFNTTISDVKEVVFDIYNHFPQTASFEATNPDNYEIVQISSNTQLGRELLGEYLNN
ncbi:MORN repeat protein [Tenacibaculum adriaticum]|uniref:MORN repeat protein n=1 Tax=Tenacibaculum adriaticum TaxID=413713 RepID=A0A5S5DMT7_9FLAO|nr:hypothetical protein [Tenacibaculum adriaticum]TYP97035.1 MORN repeat protein [Tenacibaculum adriaticum]